MNVRYPQVVVQLTGEDGNAGRIMGAVSEGLRRAGVPAAEITEYRRESLLGDYDNLLRVAMSWVTVE